MIIQGSMRHTASGRKKKNAHLYRKKKSANAMGWTREKRIMHEIQKSKKEYPSAPISPYTPAVDNSWKVEESKNFTVAPAYNKGEYQVIPRDCVEDIGK